MAEPHVISALVSKRAELAGIIARNRQEIIDLSSQIKAIDKSIKVFDPSYKIETIGVKLYYQKNRYFKRGELTRTIMEVIRDHAPISTLDIAQKLIELKGITVDEKGLSDVNLMTTNVLAQQKYKGKLSVAGYDEGGNVWEVAGLGE